jgi:hypothetical protein
MLDGTIHATKSGDKGVDCNEIIRPAQAAALKREGYIFAARYIRRDLHQPNDLTTTEARMLLSAGLGLMLVQHVEVEDPRVWQPTAAKGRQYGINAVSEALSLGIRQGATIWLDVESVDPEVPTETIIAYCNRWHEQVAGPGYVPGLYVGVESQLSPEVLYRRLRFQHYWRGLGVHDQEGPAVRGFQMRQRQVATIPGVPGYPGMYQIDTITADALGGTPTVLARAGWPE